MVVLQALLGLLVIAAIVIVGYTAGLLFMKYIIGLNMSILDDSPILGIVFSTMVGLLVLVISTALGVIVYEIGSSLITLIS